MKMSGFIGYAIASLIIIPVAVFVYNSYYIKENRDVTPFSKQYVGDTVELNFKMPSNKLILGGEDPYKWELITTHLSRKNMGPNGSRRSTYFYQDIYSKGYNKHIRIAMFDLSNLFWFDIGDSTVMLKVNKEDFNNPKYGSNEKPLMCFSLRGANGPILIKGRGTKNEGKIINKDTPPEQFEYNVYMYLTYVMPRKEFKERFGK